MLSSSRDRGDDRALPDPFNRLLHPMLQLTEVALSRSLLGQSLTELHRERLWNQIEGRLWDLLSCYQWSFRDVWLYVPVPTSSLTKPTFNVFWCGLFVTGGRLMKAKDNVHMVNLFLGSKTIGNDRLTYDFCLCRFICALIDQRF